MCRRESIHGLTGKHHMRSRFHDKPCEPRYIEVPTNAADAPALRGRAHDRCIQGHDARRIRKTTKPDGIDTFVLLGSGADDLACIKRIASGNERVEGSLDSTLRKRPGSEEKGSRHEVIFWE